MSCGLLLALMLITMGRGSATAPLTLEIRVFDGVEEVTSQTRATLHRTGERGDPLNQWPAGSASLEVQVPEGIYDVQVIRERDGRVVNIRWAQRLVVMPYPDEGGHHLEILNFQNGFGALQVRAQGQERPAVAIYKPADRTKPVAMPFDGPGYLLFIVPAGKYDLHVRTAKTAGWHTDIEVPLDRTRLWIVP
jgi:hypothetical protein